MNYLCCENVFPRITTVFSVSLFDFKKATNLIATTNSNVIQDMILLIFNISFGLNSKPKIHTQISIYKNLYGHTFLITLISRWNLRCWTDEKLAVRETVKLFSKEVLFFSLTPPSVSENSLALPSSQQLLTIMSILSVLWEMLFSQCSSELNFLLI